MLNVQEAAVAYQMFDKKGPVPPILQSSIDAVQKNQNLVTETIIDLIINSKLGAE